MQAGNDFPSHPLRMALSVIGATAADVKISLTQPRAGAMHTPHDDLHLLSPYGDSMTVHSRATEPRHAPNARRHVHRW
ncbi:hypothetical protein MHPYR_440059 [uncultured Mycobacterium sp.]|uniref:Uncharacterized protein n=1 Tax=uncultured Mycobacterium sp. TaxID=171292 RepID=A0A1Y5PFP6_9MYCO|nr:hypothetical protein MHPYR_440059 [uncultured Mycobacterium sp.]